MPPPPVFHWDRVLREPEADYGLDPPFGLSGPYRDFKAYDLTLASAGGWTTVNGMPGEPSMPLRAFGLQTAFQAGANAALATMGAVVWRLKSGKGQHIEVSAQGAFRRSLS